MGCFAGPSPFFIFRQLHCPIDFFSALVAPVALQQHIMSETIIELVIPSHNLATFHTIVTMLLQQSSIVAGCPF